MAEQPETMYLIADSARAFVRWGLICLEGAPGEEGLLDFAHFVGEADVLYERIGLAKTAAYWTMEAERLTKTIRRCADAILTAFGLAWDDGRLTPTQREFRDDVADRLDEMGRAAGRLFEIAPTPTRPAAAPVVLPPLTIGPGKDQVTVNVNGPVVYGGLSDEQIRYLTLLIDEDGWLSVTDVQDRDDLLRDVSHVNRDVRDKLPRPIRDMIESDRNKGSRIRKV